MKKLRLNQPKYIFPLVIFLPLTFVTYELCNVFGGDGKKQTSKVATDSLNMELPEAQTEDMNGKMAGMEDKVAGDAYTAVDGFEEDKAQKDTINSGYSEADKDRIDKENSDRTLQERQREAMERTLAEQRRHVNAYASRGYGYSGGSSRRSSRRDELDDYAKELDYIQKRSQAAQRAIDRDSRGYDSESEGGGYGNGSSYDGYGRRSGGRGGATASYASYQKTESSPSVVRKVERKNADKFNTVTSQTDADEPLIKAMIDKTTKAHEGTRLRFKLLDDVRVNKVLIKKGTYLYGLVTGFGQQRVMATVSNILIGNKFIKVNLSVFDNDGMEGFYVPESAFREMMREAGAQAMQQNMQLDNGYSGSKLSGESMALQALQNIYQSASSAVSANIRKNKARIKYNTIVYLVNTEGGNRR
jgi:hypothetical protein